MIIIYAQGTNTSNEQALTWFKLRGIEMREEKMYKMTRENLLHILALTDQGFSEVLKHRAGEGTLLKNKLDAISSLSFNESVDFIMKNPEVLRSPIIFEENKLLVGYNSEEIRKFMPQKYRKVGIKARTQ